MKQMISMKYLIRSECLVGDESRFRNGNYYLLVCFGWNWSERYHEMMRNC